MASVFGLGASLNCMTSISSPDTCSYLDSDWRDRYGRGACLRLSGGPQWLFDDYLVEDTFNANAGSSTAGPWREQSPAAVARGIT